MKTNIVGLFVGSVAGLVLAWSGLSDPVVVRNMLLLREAHVFLLMGSAVFVAALGVRLLKAARSRAIVTSEPIGWTSEKPERRHIVGSVLFAVGWSVAATCPGPTAVMIGQGRLAGMLVGLGIVVGVLLQAVFARRRASSVVPSVETAGAAGL